MPKFLHAILAFTVLAHMAHEAAAYDSTAQNLPPLPPRAIVNGTVLYGDGSGTYTTQNYQGTPEHATLIVYEDGSVTLAAGVGHLSTGSVFIPAHDEDNYTGGYELDPIVTYDLDEAGNVIGSTSVPGGWYPGQNNPISVPDRWEPPLVWISDGEFTDTGSYSGFGFTMASTTAVQPADSHGLAWGSQPRSMIPAVRVNGELWHFAAADQAAGYDYYAFTEGRYLWVTSGSYGGWGPEVAGFGSFGGANANGFLQADSTDSVTVVPRNADGSALSLHPPVYGPPLIWRNGITYRCLTNVPGEFDAYLSGSDGYLFVRPTGVVSGVLAGTYASQTFGNLPGTFALTSSGSPLLFAVAPHWGPPAVQIRNETWKYRGSSSTADFYGGDLQGQYVQIASSKAVTYFDPSLGHTNVHGFYNGGVFQDLPVPFRGVTATGAPWTTRPVNYSGYPASVIVDGQVWFFSTTASSLGVARYLGPKSGQILTMIGTSASVVDPFSGVNLSGSYNPSTGKFFAGSGLDVKAGNADGTYLKSVDLDLSGSIAGDLDVTGNAFTLGTWTNSVGESLNGVALVFDPAGGVRFDSVRPNSPWIWRNATSPISGSIERMRLTADGKVGIGTSAPAEKLHVSGNVKVDGVIRTNQAAGDISMGEFTHPAP